MSFSPDSEESVYRDRCRALFGNLDWRAIQEIRDDVRRLGAERYSVKFHELLAAHGLLGLTLPEPYGRNASPVQFFLMREELESLGLPCYGLTQNEGIANMIVRNGSAELIKAHLPDIVSGRAHYCGALSEPDAGSDLLALRTTALRDGTDYVVNGSKLWTSGAHIARWCSTVVRTDPSQIRQRGLSVLLIDLQSPGIEIRPVHVVGGWRVNAIHFNDVRVPTSNRLGMENEGWSVLTEGLDEERMMSFGGSETRHLLSRIVHRFSDVADFDEALLEALGAFVLDAEVDRLLNLKVALLSNRNEDTSTAGPMSKVHAADLAQRFAQWAADLLVPSTLYADGEGDPLAADLEQELRAASVLSIIGGTSEIQKNTIASRLLRLPKGT